jgi:hypothetical protein
MKQVWITSIGDIGKLRVREAPVRRPQGVDLRIRVTAIGSNFADILARKGLYLDAPKLPTDRAVDPCAQCEQKPVHFKFDSYDDVPIALIPPAAPADFPSP